MNVVFVLYNDVTMVDFIGATEIFSQVAGLKLHWLAPTMDPITTSENMKVLPTGTFDEMPDDVEIFFVPGGNSTGVIHVMFDSAYQAFIKKASAKATWAGSVCTGGFIMAAANELQNCHVTTYWSQIPNFSLLKDKCGFTVADGYPRFLLDKANRRFTGGGISSSIDLALALVQEIFGTDTAQKAQLFIQYAPGPPVQSGDPTEAPPLIIEDVMEMEADYTGRMYNATIKLLNSGNGSTGSSTSSTG